jgi:RsiW-degrading membrane proteinase PrsW (M82 family)
MYYFHFKLKLKHEDYFNNICHIVYGVFAVGFLKIIFFLIPNIQHYLFVDKFLYLFPNGFTYSEFKPTILSFLSLNYFQISLPEEFCKCLAIYMAIKLDVPKTKKNYLFLGACVGAGFSILENFLYYQTVPESLEIRLILPTLFHILLGLIMGYAFSIKGIKKYIFLFLCVFLHGSYDYVLTITPYLISIIFGYFFIYITSKIVDILE